ncbi:hypothetical protein [Catenulispora pinisilvae]|uniref:hypothetical protein n=1 Tax=Catenulispora pinisilvae TaxID=2705253 RepID=UPI0018923AE7|nr:hypothetical protein [Catenulispora pinisilvae]
MTELDLGQKAAVRRLLWRMGFATRIDVPLRAYVPANKGKPDYQSFTDLDVLAVTAAPGFRIHTAIADCKSTDKRSTERMFWIRGVGDFFGAEAAYMVRNSKVTDAARQLAARLNIAVLTGDDLAELESAHHIAFDLTDPPLARLFDPAQIADYLKAFTGLDRKLDPLQEYRQFDYWVYEPYRNLTQMVSHLADASTMLDPANPLHAALLVDCCWLYLLAVCRAVEHIRATHAADVETCLVEYFFGGQVAMREKQQLLMHLRRVLPPEAGVQSQLLPPWFGQLLELVGRFTRTPSACLPALRYAEVLSAALAARRRTSVVQAFGHHTDPIAAKLLADVVGFLVAAAGLNPNFRDMARELLTRELTGGDRRSPGGSAAAPEPPGLFELAADHPE